MAEAAHAAFVSRTFNLRRLATIADWLAVAIVVSLPWSTSATAILIVVWLVALLPTLDFTALRAEVTSAAGGLPVLLWLGAALGMLWADVSVAERVAGLGGFHKLLIIPLLLVQFRRSERGRLVLYGFIASCATLLLVSWLLKSASLLGLEAFAVPNKLPGIPVKDYIAQSTEFLICVFALLALAIDRAQAGRPGTAATLAFAALLFFANIFFIATGRTALVVIPLLSVILGFRYYAWKGVAAAVATAVLLFAVAWPASSFLRERVFQSITDIKKYHEDNSATSTGAHIEFLKSASRFVVDAPVIGHGTGSMPELFRQAAAGKSGAAGIVSVNPHNQFLGVAVQIGLIGGAILIAMWIAHLALFRSAGVVPWLGVVIVVQNFVSSLFNSHLFDFFHGWLYVFGVGVLGGMMLRRSSPAVTASAAE